MWEGALIFGAATRPKVTVWWNRLWIYPQTEPHTRAEILNPNPHQAGFLASSIIWLLSKSAIESHVNPQTSTISFSSLT